VGDAYMGGLVLIVLLYFPIIYLAIKSSKNNSMHKLINLVLVVMFFIGNVKGAMIGVKEWLIGFLLIQTFFIMDITSNKTPKQCPQEARLK
jgi:NhaP-type Na+/H+ or K+/H+ antiporter